MILINTGNKINKNIHHHLSDLNLMRPIINSDLLILPFDTPVYPPILYISNVSDRIPYTYSLMDKLHPT